MGGGGGLFEQPERPLPLNTPLGVVWKVVRLGAGVGMLNLKRVGLGRL